MDTDTPPPPPTNDIPTATTSGTQSNSSSSELPSTSSKSTSSSAADKDKDDSSEGEDRRAFECNICLDTARDAVVSLCGHLFCWPCLHQWLETRPTRQSCPVCKAAVSKDKVIPLYGRGGAQVDPRSKIPPRPTPSRQEATDSHRFSWGAGMDGNPGAGSFHMSFGIGAFPFGFFASAFNWGQGQQQVPVGGLNQAAMEEQEFLSKVFLWVALVFMIWLLLA